MLTAYYNEIDPYAAQWLRNLITAGQLKPDHSRWVMGYSAAHLSCAPTETPSFLKLQWNSSRRQDCDRT